MPSEQFGIDSVTTRPAAEARDRSWHLRRLLPFLVAIVAFSIMATLYIEGSRLIYKAILRNWGIEPFRFVFVDTDTVLSAVRCLREGVDVFVVNPCDPLGRLFDYSPLWLPLAKLPPSLTQLTSTGLLIDALFFASLLLLPVGASWRDAGLIALGVISTAAVFAVERANNDLVLFALVAAGATLVCRSRGLRMIGYAAVLLAGLLKYYPMAALLLAIREKPREFCLVVLLVCAGVALFLLTMGHDLVRALHLIPTGDWFADMFGSSTVSGGLFDGSPRIQSALHIIMSVIALATALWLAWRPDVDYAVSGLDDLTKAFLLAGAMLSIGCFFTAQNIGYRAVHLLLTLPAMLTLANRGGGRRLLRYAPILFLLLLWAEGWRYLIERLDRIDGGRMFMLLGWGLREALWWTVITLLIACVVALLRRSELVKSVLPLTCAKARPFQDKL